MAQVDVGAGKDLVVLLPGIMGSALYDRDGHAVWAVRPGALTHAVRTLGRSLTSLRLPDGIGDDHPGDGVIARGLIPGLHVIPGLWSPVSGYGRIEKFLLGPRFDLAARDDRPARLMSFAYDWRLSNRFNARRLAREAGDALAAWRRRSGIADAELVLVCHSMGGLVARWFLEQEGGAEITRTLVTIGTPHRGSARAVTTLVNGMDKGVGPLRLDLTAFVRSLPSLHQLLPTYACLSGDDGSRLPIAGTGLPGVDARLLADATAFHATLAAAPPPQAYGFVKVVGIRQPTATTVRIRDGVCVEDFGIDGHHQGGDGTVPRLAAQPEAGRDVEVHEVAEHHGELQNTRSALDLLDGILTRDEIVWQGPDDEPFGVWAPDVVDAGSPVPVEVSDVADRRLLLEVHDEQGEPVSPPMPVPVGGSAQIPPLGAGGYTATVSGQGAGGRRSVHRPFLVWDPAWDGDAGRTSAPS